MAETHSYILSKLLPIIEKNNCVSICDYGCGKGELLEKLQQENPSLKLTGIDYFRKFGANNPQINNETTINYLDRENEEFSKMQTTAQFDLLISTFALHHFQYPVSELQTIAKLVKSGGFLVFIDFAFENDSRAKIAKNISSFIEEMRAAIKGRYHRHHYSLAEAEDLFKAIPVDICEALAETNELSKKEQEENIEHVSKRNSIIQQNLKEKAPEYWKEMWIPFLEQEKFLIENNGIDYNSLLFIKAKKR